MDVLSTTLSVSVTQLSQIIYSMLEMSQSTKLWDNIAERYSIKPIADEDAYQKKLQVNGHLSCALCETHPRNRYLIENDRNRARQSGR